MVPPKYAKQLLYMMLILHKYFKLLLQFSISSEPVALFTKNNLYYMHG